MRFTDRNVTRTNPTLPDGKNEIIYFDDDTRGLGFRIRSSGSRSWIYQYWHGGRARRITLGSWPALSAKLAREMVGPLARQVGEGKDPSQDKFQSRAYKESFKEVADLYLAAKAHDLRPRSLEEVERHLKKHAKPLHNIAIENLGRQDIGSLLTKITANSGPVAANRVRSSIVALFEWATREGKISVNEASFTNKRVEKSRERTLDAYELAAIWHALPLGTDYGNIVKLLILTGQRREEIGGLLWSEINLTDNHIILPGFRTKNGRQHVIPLSTEARQVIDATPRTEGRDCVFGYGVTGFSGWGRSKERLDAQLPKMTAWTLHDIRRSVATGMAGLGIQPHIIEAVLNHASGHKAGVAGVYNRQTYSKEKREALEVWSKHIMRGLSNYAVRYGLEKCAG